MVPAETQATFERRQASSFLAQEAVSESFNLSYIFVSTWR